MSNGGFLDRLIEWEDGQLPEEAETELFQELVDSGVAWQLQGMYGRRAVELIRAGLVTQLPNRADKEE